MLTRDGVRLDADVYRPRSAGPFPVLLLRQAYGRKVASTLCYAHPSWYAERGYIVVVQDVRGRGTSEGTFKAFEPEAQDGADAVAWAAGLEGSTGAVGMYGFSYQGMVQLYAAAEPSPALKAVAPAMIGWDVRNDWAYENGAFNLAGNLGWAVQLAAETARLTGRRDAYEALYVASRRLPLDGVRPARPEVIERWRDLSHYHTWLEAPAEDDYWLRVSPASALDRLVARGLPALFIGGWCDSHLPGTLAAFEAFARASEAPAWLAVGPWTHFPWDRRVGSLDFGPAAVTAMDQLQVRWFDHWLKGRDTGLLDEPVIRLFDMGEGVAAQDRWRGFRAWPDDPLVLHLAGGGRAALDGTDGRLSREAPAGEGAEAVVHDPWRPVSSIGGAYGSPPGPVERSAVDARPDVLTFTAAPLAEPLALAGDVALDLRVLTEAPSFDIGAVLSRVTPDGRVYPLSEGYGTFAASAEGRTRLPLRATCATLQAGEALRLSLSLASFPAHPVNPGTGATPSETPIFEAEVITLYVLTGPGGSRLSVSASTWARPS